VTDSARRWTEGDYLTHRFNPELGVGRVTAVEGRALVVHFEHTGKTLRIAANSDAVAKVDEPGFAIPGSGFDASERPLGATDDEILLGVRRLRSIRESGIGSFLGGRVRLFPHQLYVAERATATDRVRWLLADEVGLGKTIEACLILNHLVHTRSSARSAQGVERCLMVVPEALTVQWLGELWRKYHHVFTLLDGPRLADVARDFGAGFNPFDVHRRAVIALETLTQRPELTEQAVSARIDLLIVDEAQRLRRPSGHPGDARYRAIAPIAALGRHVLLLSATPLEDDAHGFFRLLQLLRPEEFPDEVSVDERLAIGTPLPPCTSSTRRSDIGGLPARIGIRIDLPDDERRAEVEVALRRVASGRLRIDRIRRALASGAAFAAVLGPNDRDLRQQADAADMAARECSTLARGEGEDAHLRRASRDARDAAHRTQPTCPACERRLSRRSVRGATRYRSCAISGSRRSESDGVDRGWRGGAEFRVLPPPDSVRSAVETDCGRTADRPPRSHRPEYAGGDCLLPSSHRHRR
jgi:ATP-dependent helicase HepA